MVGDRRGRFDAAAALLMFATALAGAYAPRYLTQRSGGTGVGGSTTSLAFHLGNTLSAGVMLSAGFCHLLAESLHVLSFTGRFPTATFLAALGYILTLLADQVVQHLTEAAPDGSPGAGGVFGGGKPPSAGDDLRYSAIEMGAGGRGGGGGGLSPLPLSSAAPPAPAPAAAAAHHRRHVLADGDDEEAATLLGHGIGGSDSAAGRLLLQHRFDASGGPGGPLSPAPGARECTTETVAAVQMLCRKRLGFATAVLLAAALCVHSILEGMALGSQSDMKNTEDIFIAIIAHKGLAAYALGASVVESGASERQFWAVVGMFAAATPLGIGMGYALSDSNNGAGGAALSALASGTFIYVATMEVIPKELADPSHRGLKTLMLLTGFGLMSLLAVWA